MDAHHSGVLEEVPQVIPRAICDEPGESTQRDSRTRQMAIQVWVSSAAIYEFTLIIVAIRCSGLEPDSSRGVLPGRWRRRRRSSHWIDSRGRSPAGWPNGRGSEFGEKTREVSRYSARRPASGERQSLLDEGSAQPTRQWIREIAHHGPLPCRNHHFRWHSWPEVASEF
jgi:hypothetical protein